MVVRVSKIVVRAIKLQDDFQEHVLGDHRHIPMTPNVDHHSLIQDRIPQRYITAHVKSKQGSTALLPDNNFRLHYGAGANPTQLIHHLVENPPSPHTQSKLPGLSAFLLKADVCGWLLAGIITEGRVIHMTLLFRKAGFFINLRHLKD
jgi:hypothetical protein